MLIAVAAAEDGSAAALLRAGDEHVLTRLLRQVAAHDVSSVTVVTRAEWAHEVRALVDAPVRTAESFDEAVRVAAGLAVGDAPVLFAEASAVMHDAVVGLLLADPRISTGVVTSPRTPAADQLPLKVDHGRVVAVAAEGATGAVGLLKVATPDGAQLPASVDEVFGVTPAADVVSTLTAGLINSGSAMAAAPVRKLFYAPLSSQSSVDDALSAMAAIDEDTALLDAAVKEQDGFFTTFFVSPYSRYIARWAARRHLTPNQVTTVSMAIGIAAAAAFAEGSRAGLIAGAVLLQIAFVADCVDGQLARYTRQFSAVGAWLDSVFDRSKEYVVFAGLALGAVRTGGDDSMWLLAGAALALQTVRHTVDFGFAAARSSITSTPAAQPVPDADATEPDVAEERAGAGGAGARLGRMGIAASASFERRPAMKWLKRIVVLPIGERFALISLTAALGGPRTTFVALLVWGGLAMLYTASGRVLRTMVA